MLRRFRGRSAWMVVPLALLLIANPFADAAGGRGGHSGGGHRSAPRPPAHASAMKAPAPRVARAPHPSTAARTNASVAHNNSATHNNSVAHNNGVTRNNSGTNGNTGTHTNSSSRTSNPNNTMSLAARIAPIHTPSTYAYRTGNSTRNYRPSGYGRGYRNNYNGNNRNYGRSQSNDRSLVARLRSVHTTLVRITHDYRGHRTRAAHQISLAIRHLSHGSMYSNNSGFSGRSSGLMTGVNGTQNLNGQNGTRRQNVNRNGNGNGQRGQLTPAQSDSRMAQALRTTQGVSMQLSQQSQSYSSHRLAHGRLQRAMHEMNLALATR
jgi:hypothetical protein